jgi:succinate dehydrogenase / fumarate reductase, cytochrome b subunit
MSPTVGIGYERTFPAASCHLPIANRLLRMSSSAAASSPQTFFRRNEFLIRRLHSLSGLIPVGAYMCVHLMTNASLLAGADVFQDKVFLIHSLPFLPAIEWAFIFLPILFHAGVGVWIATTGKSNVQNYKFTSNRRYSWQRITGYIAFIFIFVHVFHLHGWFHNDAWLKGVAEPLGMAQFKPYNAASTLAVAMTGFLWPLFYLIGVLACTYHLANGVWTAGITWGVWISPTSQRWASYVCSVFGLFIGLLGISSLVAAKTTDPSEAMVIENQMYDARVKARAIAPDPHKRSDLHDSAPQMPVPVQQDGN